MENSTSDIQFIKDRYAKARNQFKPNQVRILFIAEAPSNSLDRYFYFEDVKKHDSLFLEIMGVLYPKQKQRYLASGRDAMLKRELLESFQEDGYWLLELSEVPGTLLDGSLDSCLPFLLERLERFIDKMTPVILIKSNVFDICYAPLVSTGYQVSGERIPFPGSGQQRVFRQKIAKALASC